MAIVTIFEKPVKHAKCSNCSAEWPIRVSRPVQCPRCHCDFTRTEIAKEFPSIVEGKKLKATSG